MEGEGDTERVSIYPVGGNAVYRRECARTMQSRDAPARASPPHRVELHRREGGQTVVQATGPQRQNTHKRTHTASQQTSTRDRTCTSACTYCTCCSRHPALTRVFHARLFLVK